MMRALPSFKRASKPVSSRSLQNDQPPPVPSAPPSRPSSTPISETLTFEFPEPGPLGISLRSEKEKGVTKVVRLIAETQGQRSGIRPGDVLVSAVAGDKIERTNFVDFIGTCKTRPIRLTVSRPPALPDRVQVGFLFDVLHKAPLDELQALAPDKPPSTGWRWRPAEVFKVMPGRQQAEVRFLDATGGQAQVELGEDDCNFAPHNLKAPAHIMHHAYRTGDVLDVLDIFPSKFDGKTKKKWRKCQVVAISTYFIRVNFIGWDERHNLWLHVLQESERLAGFGLYSERAQVEETARERDFRAKLKEKGLEVVDVSPDGNCLFRAIALAVYNDASRHKEVREHCCDFMEENAATFQHICLEGEKFSDYVSNMRQAATWGDDPEIRAMELLYDRPVEIYSCDVVGNDKDRDVTVPMNIQFASFFPSGFQAAPIRLSFHGNNHYNFVADVKNPPAPILDKPHENAQRLRKHNMSSSFADKDGPRPPVLSLDASKSKLTSPRAAGVVQELV